MEKASDLLSRLEEQSKQVRERIAQVHQSELASLEQSLRDLTSGARSTIERAMVGQLEQFQAGVETKLGGAVGQIESYRAQAQAQVDRGVATIQYLWWGRLAIGFLISAGIFLGLLVPMQLLARKIVDRVEQLDTLDRQIKEAEQTAGQAKFYTDPEGRKWVQVTIPSGQIVRSENGRVWVEIGARVQGAALWRDTQGHHWARMGE